MNITHIVLVLIATHTGMFVFGAWWGSRANQDLLRDNKHWRTLAQQLGGKPEERDE